MDLKMPQIYLTSVNTVHKDNVTHTRHYRRNIIDQIIYILVCVSDADKH